MLSMFSTYSASAFLSALVLDNGTMIKLLANVTVWSRDFIYFEVLSKLDFHIQDVNELRMQNRMSDILSEHKDFVFCY